METEFWRLIAFRFLSINPGKKKLKSQYIMRVTFQLFAAAVLASYSVIALSSQVPCQNISVQVKPRKLLKLLRQDFLFVEKPSALSDSLPSLPRRSRRVTAQMPGTSTCPWRWAQDDNPNRVPRFLTKAVCPNCGHYCRSVLYSHRTLVQKCDVKTGQLVWKWTFVKLPVAFVYDPWEQADFVKPDISLLRMHTNLFPARLKSCIVIIRIKVVLIIFMFYDLRTL